MYTTALQTMSLSSSTAFTNSTLSSIFSNMTSVTTASLSTTTFPFTTTYPCTTTSPPSPLQTPSSSCSDTISPTTVLSVPLIPTSWPSIPSGRISPLATPYNIGPPTPSSSLSSSLPDTTGPDVHNPDEPSSHTPTTSPSPTQQPGDDLTVSLALPSTSQPSTATRIEDSPRSGSADGAHRGCVHARGRVIAALAVVWLFIT